ncbi:MAG TPA: type II secretion system secretin GspD [Steroidobacteraceae bacterium]|jgi:general secretion pathway protein D|nr:type II secretion system secretin GspD [Steroidobacteraceae bacterium]
MSQLRTRLARAGLLSGILLLAFAWQPAALAQDQAAATQGAAGTTDGSSDGHLDGSAQRITLNFTNADIQQIITEVCNVTHRNCIPDPRVRAQVTVVFSTPLSPPELWQAFLAILQVHGFIAVTQGTIVKIVPDANMRQYPSDDLPAHISSTSDEVVTQVLAVKNLSAAQLVPVLRPLMPQQAQLSSVSGANILVMSAHANDVARMMSIVARLDQLGNPDFDVMTLQSATADDTARVLNSLLAQTESGTSVKIVADDRSNSIIVSGDPATRLRVRALIAQLDTPVENGTATQVRYLLFSDATDLATRLKEQMSANKTETGATPNARQFNQSLPNAQGNTGPSSPAAGGASPAGPATISLAGGQATIWADKDTNALIMTADSHTLRALNDVIDRLDIRRPQVLVQAIIADVAFDKTNDLGINWAVDGSATNVGIGGFISPVAGSSIVDLYDDIAGGATALGTNPPTGGTIGIGKLSAGGTDFALMLRALQGDARTNIIATPSVVTRDNQEAKMEVAEEVPFLTGQYSTTNGTGSAFQTIQQEDVGTLMTVTPTISSGNVVLLKLNVESSSISSSASGVAGDPITNKNTVTTSVLIGDGGTLVLGGLIQDSVTNNQQSIPLLGNIPLLGELFRTRNNEKTKTDFLIFLQPRILRDDQEATIETDAKYNFLRGEQRRVMKDSTLLPLAPYEPADPLPPITNGDIPPMFGAGPPVSGAPGATQASPARDQSRSTPASGSGAAP